MEQKMTGMIRVQGSKKQAVARLIIGSLLLFVLLFVQGSFARCLASDPSDFVIEDGVLTKYTGSDSQVVVPDTVTKIGNSAFIKKENNTTVDNTTLQSVKFDGNVTEIGEYAFGRCTSLVSVALPDSVTVIGKNAFKDCSSLVFINMPASLQTIGYQAFSGCEQLTEVVMPDTVTSLGGSAFIGCHNLSSVKLSSKLTAIESGTFTACSSLLYVTVPSGVTKIGNNAFSNCSNLLSVSLPSSVESIGSYCFTGCSSLLYLRIPDKVTVLNEYMFRDTNGGECNQLYALQIPKGVTTIGNKLIPYYKGNHLQTVYYGGTKEEWENITFRDEDTKNSFAYAEIQYGAKSIPAYDQISPAIPSGFAHAGSLNTDENGFTVVDGVLLSYSGTDSEVTVPEGVTYISPGVFQDNGSLTKVTLPASLYGIGESAFLGCTNLTQVVFTGNTYMIGEKAFRDCSALESINLPEGMVSLSAYLFSGCSKLQNITLPDTLITIESYALKKCGLTSLTIPGQVLSLKSGALQDCDEMINCSLPEGLKTVSMNVFYHCDKLTSLSFPEHTKSIASTAFSNCYAITSIELPKDLKKIEYGMFQYCNNLQDLEIPKGVRRICGSAFFSCAVTSLNLPAGLEEIDNSAFTCASGLTVLVIPDGVKKIGDNAFNDCYNLKTIYIPSSVDKIEENIFADCIRLENIYFQGSQEEWEEKGGQAALQNAPVGTDETAPLLTVDSDPSALAALIVYRIRYDLQGGRQNSSNPNTYTPVDPDITLGNPWRTGYNFVGWTLDGSSDGPQKEVTIHCADGGDKKFTANWERQFEITYQYHGGREIGGSINKRSYTENDDDFELIPLTRSGYEFLGWTGSNGDVPQKKVTVVVSEGGARTYEANWARIHTLNFALDGGSAPSDVYPDGYPVSYTEVDPYLAIANPVKDGTEFLGWLIKGKDDGLVKDLVIPQGSTEDYNLTAIWKNGRLDKEVYQITYNLNGGWAEGNPDTYTSNDPDIYIKTPHKEGYYFTYWSVYGAYYVRGASTEMVIPHGCRGDIRFTAYYEECDHEVDSVLPKKDPTCTEPGYEEGTCCRCGKIAYPGETIPALGHQMDEGVITKQPTATQTGIKTYTCARCKETREEVIPALGEGGQSGNDNGQGGNGQGSAGTVSGNTTGNGSGSENGSESGDMIQQGEVGKVGVTFTMGKGVYQVTKSGKEPEVTYLRPSGKKTASATIPATVKYKGVTYKVTAIGPKAFAKWKKKLGKVTIGKNVTKIGKEAFKDCKKLKTIVIKTSKLKKKGVGKNAFKNVHANAKAKVPKKKLSTYKAILKKAGIKGKQRKIVKA
ncbi:MAG: leucine-rich repeat protein [Lachnospiraceae bacterium]|nr:leucine-rich repeat protein [Lachnospiraceae bacterium]